MHIPELLEEQLMIRLHLQVHLLLLPFVVEELEQQRELLTNRLHLIEQLESRPFSLHSTFDIHLVSFDLLFDHIFVDFLFEISVGDGSGKGITLN